MSNMHPPWPIAVVTGLLGSGKTTMITRLLHHAGMRDTIVLVNEFGEIGLDHHLIRAVTDTVVLLPNGCLCCTIRQDVVQTLRDLRRSWLAGSIPDFARVLIETTGLAEPAPLIASIAAHPLLVDAFELQSIVTLVDGEYGLDQIASSVTCRNQVCVADHLVISKGDLITAEAVAMLTERLLALNVLASVNQGQDVDPNLLFQRSASRARKSALFCEQTHDHLSGISTVFYEPEGPLVWTAFQTWLGSLLEEFGPQLLRLKGRLRFVGSANAVIIQAVHHSFYPVVEAPTGDDPSGKDFLVMIFEGELPPDLDQGSSTIVAALDGRSVPANEKEG